MRFTDLQYGIFLAVVWVVFRALRGRRWFAVLWLTVASLSFYGSFDPRYLLLLSAATILDYAVGARLGREECPAMRKRLLGVSIVGNLGMLGVFKYGDFILESVEAFCRLLGFGVTLPRLGIGLPIGISFYSFQTLSYSIDVYRRQLAPARNLLEFFHFVSFFPQLVAGPIVRASEFLPQVHAPSRRDAGAIGQGLVLICIGMAKKLVLGDTIGRALVDPFFANPSRYNAGEAWLADWAAYFSLYCDFSGYTDIAIGSALLFGIVLPVNFDRPAFAPSPLEHWRRWHMTLGSFLRDYLYFPLGGSRAGRLRLWLNLFLVFFVSGVWHGVGASYVLMGLWNGVLAATWRLLRPTPGRGAALVFESLVAFQLTALSVMALRPIPLDRLGASFRSLFSFERAAGGLWDPTAAALLVGVILLHLSPRGWKERALRAARTASPAALALLVVIVGGFCSLYAVEARDFYYFQF
ncbi:MAG: MBOAT family protein [Myxococcales bacterium]|nr:MBOAT family protein [Myxococcales bacterium]